jgi:hypothetical protein
MLNGQHKRRATPRNAIILALIERGVQKAGAHGKSRKAERRGEKVKLMREAMA